MLKSIPKLGESLKKEHISFLEAFAKSCRETIIETLKNSQSGHPGGSLSTLDFLVLLYTFILSQTGEKIVISNGHISPGVYSVLAEMGYASKEDVIKTFRKFGSNFEGHVTRHIPGIFFGTGPLGVGVSAASAFALAEKRLNSGKKVYCTVGDGEIQEGQVHEMLQFSGHYKLNNLIVFVDYNKVQLTASLKEIQNINIKKIFEAGNWKVIEADGHDYKSMWKALEEAHKEKEKPVLILGDTIMGKGVECMEKDGRSLLSKWHGAPPKPDEADCELKKLILTDEEKAEIENFKKFITWHPEKNTFPEILSKLNIDPGKPIVYGKEEVTDCRSAYGKALADLAKLNKNILGLSADLKGSVMVKTEADAVPDQYIECGIAEQHMVTLSGGLSLYGYVPFCSTFGAFMTSRAKDQARVNDINHCNVKMVATHCGLSVGEDGPTHQAIDDMGSFLGLYETMIIEPADPNQTDRIIRYIGSHYGNFYVRMGRHKLPTLTKENGEIFFDENYKYEYGRTDRLREGKDITLACMGAITSEALKARENLQKTNPEISVEIIIVSSVKKFDETLLSSIKKTKRLITIEDHNINSGLGSQLAKAVVTENIHLESFEMLGTTHYELSGTVQALYKSAGIDSTGIEAAILKSLKK